MTENSSSSRQHSLQKPSNAMVSLNLPIIINDDDDATTTSTITAKPSSPPTIIEHIDLDAHEQEKRQLWQQIRGLCKKLLLCDQLHADGGGAPSSCNPSPRQITEQHVIIKQIDHYAIRIKEESLWKYLLRQYYRLSRTSLHVSVETILFKI